MKRNVIALLLAVVVAASSVGTIPVVAAETTAQGAASQEEAVAQEEEVEEDAADTADTSAEAAEAAADEEPASETEEAAADEEPFVETEEAEEETVEKEAALAEGDDVVDSGTCGEDVVWTLTGADDDLTLTISGSGKMDDYDHSSVPWASNTDKIKTVIVENGITGIGNRAFDSCFGLTSATIPDGVTIIGDGAFSRCSKLESIAIPDSVTIIGPNAFGWDETIDIRFCGTKAQWDSAVGDFEVPYKSIVYDCFSVDADAELSGESYTYTGKAIKPAVTVTYDGQELINGTDYELIYKNNTNAGTASVVVRGKGEYFGSIAKTFKITKADNKITGSNYTRSYSTKAQAITLNAKATGGKMTYKSNKSAVKVTSAGKVTIGAKFSGTATITITAGSANYKTVTKKITVTVPAKIALVSAANVATRKMKVTWKKNTTVSGYQIEYSLKSSFAGAKFMTIYKNTLTSTTIGSLAKGKKYYVRIRSFKTANGKKFYSAWSAAKAVAIKK